MAPTFSLYILSYKFPFEASSAVTSFCLQQGIFLVPKSIQLCEERILISRQENNKKVKEGKRISKSWIPSLIPEVTYL